MKKLIQIGLSSILVFPVMALGVCAANWNDNTTSMVTYFPVPYAAYNNIYVSDKFDVGTSTSNFLLNLGSGGIEQRALEANTVTLRSTAGVNAQFTINSDVYTPVAYFGNVKNPTGTTATLQFKNLRIGSQPDISNLTVNIVKLQALNLFGANLGGATCNGTVQTKTLNLGAGNQKYMVCCPTGESCGDACYFTDKKKARYESYCTTRVYNNKIAGTWCSGESCSQGCGCQCDTAISTRETVMTSGDENQGATYCKPKCSTEYWNNSIVGCTEQAGSERWDYNTCECVCKNTYELDDNVCRALTWKATRNTVNTAKPENESCPTGYSTSYNEVISYHNGAPCTTANKSHGTYSAYRQGVVAGDATQCFTETLTATCSVN